MARLFNDALSQYLENLNAVVSGEPFTFACWAYSDDLTAAQLGISVAPSGSPPYYALGFRGDVAGDPIQALIYDGTNLRVASTSTGYSSGIWHHICGVFASSTSRAAYIDGGSKGTNTQSYTGFTPNRTRIGARASSQGVLYLSGAVAHPAIWNAALTDDEVAALAAGAHPLTVRPGSLVAHWPLVRTDQDLVGGFGMTPVNSPTFTDHPPKIFGPAPVLTRFPATTYQDAAASLAAAAALAGAVLLDKIVSATLTGVATLSGWLHGGMPELTAPFKSRRFLAEEIDRQLDALPDQRTFHAKERQI